MLREIQIIPALNGWIVRVGCQTLVFSDMERMLTELEAYLRDPGRVERDYRENSINAKYTMQNPVHGTADNAAPPVPSHF